MTSTSTSLFLIAHQTVTAAPWDDCQSKNILPSALSSHQEEQSGSPCITTVDSLVNSEVSKFFECENYQLDNKQRSAIEDQLDEKQSNAPQVADLNPSNLRSPISAVEQMLKINSTLQSITQQKFPGQSQPNCTTLTGVSKPRSNSNPISPTLHYPTAQRSTQTSEQLNEEPGELRLREVQKQRSQPNAEAEAEDELGRLRIRQLRDRQSPANADPELGRLRIREAERQPRLPDIVIPPPSSPQLGSLLAQIGYFQTNNIFSGVDPVEGGLLSSGITLITTPNLGPNTDIIAAIDGSLIRYIEQSESNYNQFRVRAGIRQQISPRMYGEIGLINQQLFRSASGDRFLNENALRLVLRRRDRLTNKLRLDSLYELRVSDAEPETRSRIINSLTVSLSYNIQNNFLVGLDYQYALSDFTQREREDEYHRILGRLTYAVSRRSQINLQSGVTLGGSSDPNINFDNFFLGVTYTIELGKF